MSVRCFFFSLAWLICQGTKGALTCKTDNIKRVCVVGGTHGNEYTGVFVINHLEKTRASTTYDSIALETLISNGAAVSGNVRFVDEDLNRRFSVAKLAEARGKRESGGELSLEERRSLELDAALGPKGEESAADLVIDLHTTTANMGTVLIVDAWDPWAQRCAAYVVQQLALEEERLGPFFSKAKILYNDIRDKSSSPYLASVGKRAMQIEVGPTAQGLLRHDVVDATSAAVAHVLAFVELFNAKLDPPLPTRVEAFTTAGSHAKISWPVDDRGFPTAITHKHLQGRDWEPLRPGDALWFTLEGETVSFAPDDGEAVYPIFVNEAGYYYASSGRGIGFTKRIDLTLPLAPVSDE